MAINRQSYFDAVKDESEKILWLDGPEFWPFVSAGLPFLLMGLAWGLFDYMLMGDFNKASAQMQKPLQVFFAIHALPLWLSIANQIRLFLIWGNTAYAISTKRVMLRSGFWGTDFRAIDHDRISDTSVDVSPLDTFFHSGTIVINTGIRDSNGQIANESIRAVRNPYEVFRILKTVSVDVKTDWEYPNAMRPDMNPGYKTNYSTDKSQ